jgi:transcription termination/antitermination protein NusG
MPEEKIKSLFGEMNRRKRAPLTFRLGDTVRILDGPFAAFTGSVEGINQSKRLLKVRVEIFGKTTPIKLGFTDAEKVSSPLS